jgi:nucleoside 2-deoxyribosyltransferase
MTKIYCSGPLFCPEERAGMLAISRVFEDAGFTTYLPQRDGLERVVLGRAAPALVGQALHLRGPVDRAIFALDVFELVERCHVVVVNLNGRVPDEGAAVEAGLAFAVGKPVVLYKDDIRAPFSGGDNSMLLGLSARGPVTKLTELPAAVRRALEGATPVPPPPAHLAKTLALGARITAWLGKLPSAGRDGLAEELAALVQSNG